MQEKRYTPKVPTISHPHKQVTTSMHTSMSS